MGGVGRMYKYYSLVSRRRQLSGLCYHHTGRKRLVVWKMSTARYRVTETSIQMRQRFIP